MGILENNFQKIGIFGGTFNPIHYGHLRTVEEVREYFNLNAIFYVLAKMPPHKLEKNLVSANERYNILKIALQENPFFKPSSIELERDKVSYTIDTIKYFKQKFNKAELFFIMGSDAFLEIDTWFQYENLLKLTNIIVMFREDFEIKETFLKKLGYLKKNNLWVNIENRKVLMIKVTRLDIASSKIRESLKNNKSVNYLLPEECLKYIYKKKLYK